MLLQTTSPFPSLVSGGVVAGRHAGVLFMEDDRTQTPPPPSSSMAGSPTSGVSGSSPDKDHPHHFPRHPHSHLHPHHQHQPSLTISLSKPLGLFSHQVGGHCRFFKLTDRTVCKPLIPAENEFYRSLSSLYPDLIPFIPKYLGTITNTGGKSAVTGKSLFTVVLPGTEELNLVFGNIHIVPSEVEEVPFEDDMGKGSSPTGLGPMHFSSPKSIPCALPAVTTLTTEGHSSSASFSDALEAGGGESYSGSEDDSPSLRGRHRSRTSSFSSGRRSLRFHEMEGQEVTGEHQEWKLETFFHNDESSEENEADGWQEKGGKAPLTPLTPSIKREIQVIIEATLMEEKKSGKKGSRRNFPSSFIHHEPGSRAIEGSSQDQGENWHTSSLFDHVAVAVLFCFFLFFSSVVVGSKSDSFYLCPFSLPLLSHISPQRCPALPPHGCN